MKQALQTILVISFIGLMFSGYLSYQELFAGTVRPCPAPGAPGTVLSYPACIYGFFMYLAVAIISALGLRAGRRHESHTMSGASTLQPH